MVSKKEVIKKGMTINREALVSIMKTSNLLVKAAGKFFSNFVITDAQFNILMILKQEPKGINQQELSEKLLVTKSNVVGLIDRMEKSGLVERKKHSTDRRCHTVMLSKLGLEMLAKVEDSYHSEVDRIMSVLDVESKKNLILITKKLETVLMREL